MSKAIRESISKTFGFEPICINSALVSAQNRQRLYWVGKRNEDGTYSKVHVEQPEDRGILLRDVLDSGVYLSDKDKSYALTTRCCGAIPEDTLTKNRHSMVAEELKPLTEGELDYMVRKTSGDRNHFDFGYIQDANKDKGACLTANISKGVPYNVCCVPVRVGSLPSEDGTLTNSQGVRIYSIDGKGITLCGNGGGQGAKTGLYAEPMRVQEATTKGYVDIEVGDCVDLTMPNSKTRRGRSMKDKSNCLMTGCQYYQYIGTTKHPIYEVLVDGYYIIRKLTVSECKRLQTVPEWYEFPVSDTQAYKMLGNGWTVEVIAHLVRATQTDVTDEKQIDLIEMAGA
jgi:DNA (cytosine-5)-methyltransferase 3A